MRRRLRALLLLAALPAAVVVAVVVANAIVLASGRGSSRNVADVPRAEAALVLGAQVRPDGSPSGMLADRVAAAAALYRAGRVGKLLLSGDHGRRGYDEVGTMRRLLLARGIPAADLFTDHAGFDTWDSAQRARRVFGVRSVVVVTQDFHMARSLFAVRRAGLRAAGLSADLHDYGRVMPRLRAREVLARVKVVGDAVLGTEPRFLGPPVPIGGDGRVSWGPEDDEGRP